MRKRTLALLAAILLLETGWGGGCGSITSALGM